jgi:F-type H+-transporting ATPase subunit b
LWIGALVGSLVLLAAGSVSASTGESGGGGVTVVPDGSFIIQIINFVFLIFVLNILLYRPIRQILVQRKEKINGLELSIQSAEAEAVEKDQAVALGIREARARGLKAKDVLLGEASEEEKRILADINQRAQARLGQMRAKIADDVENAKASLQQQTDEFANEISVKILGRAV